MNTKKEILETIPAQYFFNDVEKLELGLKLGNGTAKLSELEGQKKSVTADFNGQIESVKAQIGSLSQKVTSGYEMRETECVVTFDPKSNTKHYHNRRTGEFVRSAEMTRADYQFNLPVEESQPSAPRVFIDVPALPEHSESSLSENGDQQ